VSAGVRGVGQIHISVADVDRSVSFYRDVLGLQLVLEVPEQSMAFVDCGGVRLYLAPGPPEELPSRPLLYLTVDAIEESHAPCGRPASSSSTTLGWCTGTRPASCG
jgi:catechol 2,3-dioxygenase-like lactoylglutathione lyase family enzyme